jgi:cytochrome P450
MHRIDGVITMQSTEALPTTRRRVPADLPSPRGWPVLGQLAAFRPLRAHLQFEAWARELGTPFRFSLGGLHFVVLDDMALFHQASRDRPDGFTRGATLQPTFEEMGINGLFSIEGEAWHPQRRLIMQALNATHFRGWFGTLQDITSRLYRRWSRLADRGEVIEMTDDLRRYTVDVTSALAFGANPNTLETEGDRIQQQLELIFPMIMRRAFAPIRYWNRFRLPADRRLDAALVEVRAYAQERIAASRARLASDPGGPTTNALEALLLAQDEQGLTEKEVISNVITLLVAGEDTTSNSLAWTMMYLAADPGLQTRMHDRAVALLGDAAVCPDHEKLHAMDEFEPLAFEAMRFKPVVPFNSFTTRRPTVLGDLDLPAGAKLFFLKRPAMLDERNFADPLRYDPERWRRGRTEKNAPTHEPRAFAQFGAGQRVCPGRHLATLEMRLVLSMLLRHFEVELACPPDTIEEVNAFTMMPSRMPVRLRRRG